MVVRGRAGQRAKVEKTIMPRLEEQTPFFDHHAGIVVGVTATHDALLMTDVATKTGTLEEALIVWRPRPGCCE